VLYPLVDESGKGQEVKKCEVDCVVWGSPWPAMYHTIPLIPAPTRHLGANKGYASNRIYFIIKNHTFLSTTKCRVGAANGRRKDIKLWPREDTIAHSTQPYSS
jgi:hypothetical protein